MNNFIFENKTKVYFGKRCVGEYLPKIAGKIHRFSSILRIKPGKLQSCYLRSRAEMGIIYGTELSNQLVCTKFY